MDDRENKRERLLRQLKDKIRDPEYFHKAVENLAGKLVREYFQRYKSEN